MLCLVDHDYELLMGQVEASSTSERDGPSQEKDINHNVYADGHCHLQDPRITDHEERMMAIMKDPGMVMLVVNGCCPDDWPGVINLSKEFPDRIIPQLGLHPWWVSKTQLSESSWLQQLTKMLQEHPQAGLGECGLDKSCKWANSYVEQKDAFENQIRLAISLNRTLSVHCVKAYGSVFERLSDIRGRIPVLMHGWMGSPEITRMYVGMQNVFFSFNVGITRLDPTQAADMLMIIPKSRYVLESDSPDGLLCKARWDVWLSNLPKLRQMVEETGAGLDHRIQAAQRQGNPSNVVLVAFIVAAITDQHVDDVMATSVANIKQLFLQQQYVSEKTIC